MDMPNTLSNEVPVVPSIQWDKVINKILINGVTSERAIEIQQWTIKLGQKFPQMKYERRLRKAAEHFKLKYIS